MQMADTIRAAVDRAAAGIYTPSAFPGGLRISNTLAPLPSHGIAGVRCGHAEKPAPPRRSALTCWRGSGCHAETEVGVAASASWGGPRGRLARNEGGNGQGTSPRFPRHPRSPPSQSASNAKSGRSTTLWRRPEHCERCPATDVGTAPAYEAHGPCASVITS
ncbi:hypothetical protein C8Q79DRAFT_414470 [Trametes meyenii]|nr:hypothetical protein C8Q79DRAFT_414470 [Trametes meyenii]